MALSPKLRELLEALRNATAEGRVQWVEGAYEGIYKLSLKDATVFIEFVPSDAVARYRNSYSLMLKNTEDEIVELQYLDDEDQPEYQLVQSLFEAARKSSPRFNEFLDRMIADVGSRKR